MIISTAIIEDDPEQAALLKEYLTDLETSARSFNITIFESAEAFLSVMKPHLFHLIFQDIQLKKMDGLSCARRAREADENVMIVFITSMPQFAINGYEVNAKDYILKPVIFDVFERKMQRLLPMIQKSESTMINIAPDGNAPDLVRTDDILYVEIFNHNVIYHLAEGKKELYGTIGSIEKKLMPYKFVRCNRNTIVNFKHIKRISDNTVIVADQTFYIAATRKKEFLDKVNSFIDQ